MPTLTWLTRESDLLLSQKASYRLLEHAPELLAEVKDVVLDTLTLMIPEAKGDWSLVSALVRSALKKFINKRMERRPMILPIIMEI